MNFVKNKKANPQAIYSMVVSSVFVPGSFYFTSILFIVGRSQKTFMGME